MYTMELLYKGTVNAPGTAICIQVLCWSSCFVCIVDERWGITITKNNVIDTITYYY